MMTQPGSSTSQSLLWQCDYERNTPLTDSRVRQADNSTLHTDLMHASVRNKAD